MCVTLFLVIQQHVHVGSEQLEDWFTSYIGMSFFPNTNTLHDAAAQPVFIPIQYFVQICYTGLSYGPLQQISSMPVQ